MLEVEVEADMYIHLLHALIHLVDIAIVQHITLLMLVAVVELLAFHLLVEVLKLDTRVVVV